jgi:glycosyltransferase involved in cell wall biosynthesis
MTADSSRHVLMVTPHFPPDSTAATHRVRLLAPHLPRHGWTATVLGVAAESYETRLDPELATLVPDDLETVRVRAWPARWTRRFGFGDLGLRSLAALYRGAARLLGARRYDALFLELPPWYTALLGPPLSRRFDVPYVVDYIDPWVSEWGRTVGGGRAGRPDLRSRMSRAVALAVEPWAVARAAAITGVSAGTYADLFRRLPALRARPHAEIPYGFEADDFRRLTGAQPFFDPHDGQVHLVYLGTLPPLGGETLRAFLRALEHVRGTRPLRVHFVGTSGRTDVDLPRPVVALAAQLGVADLVDEVPQRVGYLDALRVLRDASAVVLLGSSEPHYTASRLFPVLLARRPVLAVFHQASSVVDILARAMRPPAARCVTYDQTRSPESQLDQIVSALAALVANPVFEPAADLRAIEELSAAALAGRLAQILDAVVWS